MISRCTAVGLAEAGILLLPFSVGGWPPSNVAKGTAAARFSPRLAGSIAGFSKTLRTHLAGSRGWQWHPQPVPAFLQ
jgi:hypothetical protein